jgi:hypothetical protein
MAHIAEFTTSGERTPLLVNFPYVFQRPVSLVTTGEIELSSDILEPVAGLQRTLKAIDIPVNIRSKAITNTDIIILGTFTPSSDLAPYLKPFNIDLEKAADGVDIPGFGKVGSTGSGILLFSHGPKTNTLILLASSAKDLPRLINLVASGDLSVCVLQENISVCNLVPPDDGSGGYNFYPLPTDIPSPTELPGPTGFPTPTPVG